MTRRSFLVRLAALVAAPAALVAGRRGATYGEMLDDARLRATDNLVWGKIPIGEESMVGVALIGRDRYRWFTREEWMKLQDRRARRA